MTNARVPLTVNPEVITSLDASLSTDSDGEIVSFLWDQTSKFELTINPPENMISNFTPSEVLEGETLRLSLTITDNEGGVDISMVELYINEPLL